MTDEQTMLAVIQAATGDNCPAVFKYEVQDSGWRLLLCETSKNSYRLNEAITPEELQRIDGQTGHLDTWKFIGGTWVKQ